MWEFCALLSSSMNAGEKSTASINMQSNSSQIPGSLLSTALHQASCQHCQHQGCTRVSACCLRHGCQRPPARSPPTQLADGALCLRGQLLQKAQWLGTSPQPKWGRAGPCPEQVVMQARVKEEYSLLKQHIIPWTQEAAATVSPHYSCSPALLFKHISTRRSESSF